MCVAVSVQGSAWHRIALNRRDQPRREVLVREGKGGKDRITVLPLSLAQALREQIGIARAIFEQARAQGRPRVMLPYALERKYPKVGSRLGHTDVSTTMIYLHVLNKGGRGIIAQMDSVM